MGKIVSNFLPVSIFFCFLFLPVVMPELVKLYNAGNSATLYFSVVAWNMKEESHRGIMCPYTCRDLKQDLCLIRGGSLLLVT